MQPSIRAGIFQHSLELGTAGLPLPVQQFIPRKLQLPEGAGEHRAVVGEEAASPAPQHRPVSLCPQGKEFPSAGEDKSLLPGDQKLSAAPAQTRLFPVVRTHKA